MHPARRANFANDNHRLSASEREAVRLALNLPDAAGLRTALREKLAEIRLHARPRRQFGLSSKAAGPIKLATLALITREAAGSLA